MHCFAEARSLTTSAGSICDGRQYNGISVPTPAPDRSLIVIDGFRCIPNAPIAGISINGSAAARVAQAINYQSYFTALSMWALAFPTGNMIDIETVFAGNLDNAEAIAVYEVYGLSSLMPVFVASSGGTESPSTMVRAKSGGFVLSASWAFCQPSTPDWFGIEQDYSIVTDPTSSSQIFSGGSRASSGTNDVMWQSCLYKATSGYEPVMLSAAFR